MSKRDFAIADVSTGTLNALVKHLMSQMDIRDADEAIRRVTSGEWTVSETPRLGNMQRISLSEFGTDLAKFFTTREGLFVWDGFRDLVLPSAKPVTVSEVNIASYDLLRDSNDEEICGELPEGHVFQNVAIFCTYLAGMIQRQWGGKDGPLLTNGYANLFYVEVDNRVVVVVVHWYAVHRKWSVDARQLNDNRWFAGRRAFSAAAVA